MYIRKILVSLLITFSSVCFANTDTLVVAHKIDNLITLDPAVLFEIIALEYANNTYQRLVAYSPDNPDLIQGEIAKSWKVTNGGKTFTFYLQRGLKFASGNPITAHDVAYSLTRAIELNKAPAFLLTQFGLSKDGIKVLDDYTLSLNLPNGQSENLFLSCLTAPVAAVVDAKIVQAHAQSNDWGNQWLTHNHAGSGAFILQQWRPNEALILTANPHYPQKLAIKSVVIRHVKEPTTQRLLLEKGDVDIARDLTDFENLPANTYLVSAPKCWLKYISLNQENQYLRIPEVRQAIKYLIDYDGLQQTILKHQAVAHQSFIPNGFMAVSSTKPFKLNVARAKELLKTAGLEKGFSIKLDVKDVQLAQALQAQFAAVNIKVEIIPGDSKQILSKFRNRDYDMLIGTWTSDYRDPHANAATFLNNRNNTLDTDNKSLAWRASWLIPELSQLTMAASIEQNTQQRIAMYKDLQEKFFAQSPLIVMFQEIETAAVNKNVTGFKLGSNADNTSYSAVKKTQ